MIDWSAQLERAESLKGGDKPQNGEILKFDDIQNIKEQIDTFETDNGGQRKVTRFYYILNSRTLIVPVSLHRKIARLKVEYHDNLKSVKVVVEGSGIKTRYDALPLLHNLSNDHTSSNVTT